MADARLGIISAKDLGAMRLPDFCPRCFWIKRHNENDFPFQIPFPGIFGSIDKYTKDAIHRYLDKNGNLPGWYPEIGGVCGYVASNEIYYSKFFVNDPASNVKLRGNPDDVLELANGGYHIVDYKTARITGTQDGLFPMYEGQLNAYAFIAEKMWFKPVEGLSLIYMEPRTELEYAEGEEMIGRGEFELQFRAVRKVVANSAKDMIPPLLREFRRIFDLPEAPAGRTDCANCERLSDLLAVLRRGGIPLGGV
ncbi:MAG: PD-(D/E)XK nuclease family protein [Candidatus Acidiferrales bacterium]